MSCSIIIGDIISISKECDNKVVFVFVLGKDMYLGREERQTLNHKLATYETCLFWPPFITQSSEIFLILMYGKYLRYF